MSKRSSIFVTSRFVHTPSYNKMTLRHLVGGQLITWAALEANLTQLDFNRDIIIK